MKPLKQLVRAALEEDIGQEDVTTNQTVPADSRCRTTLVAKQNGAAGFGPRVTAGDGR